MRSKEERRLLHRTESKRVRGKAKSKSSQGSRIVEKGGNLYEELTIDGQVLYNKLETSAKAPQSLAPRKPDPGASGGVILQSASSDGGGASSHTELTNIGPNDHHAEVHTLTSHSDWNPTGTGNVVLHSSPSLAGTVILANILGSGTLKFTDTTDNTIGNVDTGAVQFDGGAGIAGNVSIGGSLDVDSDFTVGGTATIDLDTATDGTLTVSKTDTSAFLVEDASSNMVLNVDTTNKKVGIGTSSPDATLHIANDTDSTTFKPYDQMLLTNAGGLADASTDARYAGTGYRVGSISGSGDSDRIKGWFGYVRTAAKGRGDFVWVNDSADDAGNCEIGQEVMRLSNGGRLGIGTSSPDFELEVESSKSNGTTELAITNSNQPSEGDTGQATALVFNLRQNDGDVVKAGMIKVGKSDDWTPDGNSDSFIDFYTTDAATNAFAMRINKDGAVGIGTTNPNYVGFSPIHSVLSVVSSEASGRYGQIEVGGYRTGVDGLVGDINFINASSAGGSTAQARAIIRGYRDGYDDAIGLRFYTEPHGDAYVERVRIQPDGKTGIGTTSPDYLFDVESATGGNPIVAVFGDRTHNLGLFIRATATYTSLQSALKNDYSTEYKLSLNPNGGNVGIGISDPDTSLDVLNASGPQVRLVRTSGSAYADLEAGSSTSGDLYINPDHTTAHSLILRVQDAVPPTYGTTIKTDGAQSQVKGWQIDYLGAADFRYLYTDELHAKAFIADLEQALAGGQIISKSVAMLSRDFTAPVDSGTATLYVKDLPSASDMAVFESGDWVRLRTFTRSGGSLEIKDCWGKVTSYTDLVDGEQSWTFTRASSGNSGDMTSGTVVKKDSLVLDYGTDGNGYYEVNAIDGQNAANSPYSQIVKWTDGAGDTGPGTANAFTVHARLGNLKGVHPSGNTEYGLFAGSGSATTDSYLLLSESSAELHNLPLRLFKDSSETIKIDPGAASDQPYMAVGTSVIDGSWDSANQGFLVKGDASDGAKVYIGNQSGDNIEWSGGTLKIKGDVEVTNPLDYAPQTLYDSFTNTSGLDDNKWGYHQTSISRVTTTDDGVACNLAKIRPSTSSNSWIHGMLSAQVFQRSNEPTIEFNVLCNNGSPATFIGFVPKETSQSDMETDSNYYHLRHSVYFQEEKIVAYYDGTGGTSSSDAISSTYLLTSAWADSTDTWFRVRIKAKKGGGSYIEVWKDGDFSSPVATFSEDEDNSEELRVAIITHYGAQADRYLLIDSLSVGGSSFSGTRISGNVIRTGNVQSNNYEEDGSGNTTSGTQLSLDDGEIKTTYFQVNPAGEITATKGLIADWSINDKEIWSGSGANTSTGDANMGIALRTVGGGSGAVYSWSRQLKGLTLTWHQDSNAGHLVLGDIMSDATTLKTGYMGLQMMAHDSKEYFCLSASRQGNGTSTYNRIAGWRFDNNTLTSSNYGSGGNGTYTDGGIQLHSEGAISGKNFRIDTNGDAYFRGNIQADSGKIDSSVVIGETGTTKIGNPSQARVECSPSGLKVYASNVWSDPWFHIDSDNATYPIMAWKKFWAVGGIQCSAGDIKVSGSSSFVGSPAGLDGTAPDLIAGTASVSTKSQIGTEQTSASDHFVAFSSGTSGENSIKTSGHLKYNPSSQTLTATNFSGNASSATEASKVSPKFTSSWTTVSSSTTSVSFNISPLNNQTALSVKILFRTAITSNILYPVGPAVYRDGYNGYAGADWRIIGSVLYLSHISGSPWAIMYGTSGYVTESSGEIKVLIWD